MRRVLHFGMDDAAKAACGAQIVLCDDCTDDRRHVDCGRCKRTKQFTSYDPARYDVDVWNHEGDVIRSARGLTASEADSIREEFEGDASVVVTDAAPAGH